MRRFLITSPRFTGNIEVHYDASDIICAIFFRANLEPKGLQWLKARIPATGSMDIEQAFEGQPVTIEQKEFEVTWDDFKREYPYSRNMHLALAYWPKLNSSDQYQCFISLAEYRKYYERNREWYKYMLPEKYLKTKQWLNQWAKL